VLGVERFAVVAQRDPGFTAHDVLERQVRRIAAVAELDNVFRSGFDSVKQGVERNALPDRVQLRPLGHAMDVDFDLFARQRPKLLPGPAARLVNLADDRKVPAFNRCARRWAG
jgi:hypothetical protein